MLTRFWEKIFKYFFLIKMHDFRMFTKRGFVEYTKKFDYYRIFLSKHYFEKCYYCSL